MSEVGVKGSNLRSPALTGLPRSLKAYVASAKADDRTPPGDQLLAGPGASADLLPSFGTDRGWAVLVVKELDRAFFLGLFGGLGLKDCSSKDLHL